MSLTEQAYGAIKDQVIGGKIPPGTHFDAGHLATDLAMSRTPVREALLRLQNEGIVEILPKKGIQVATFTPGELREIYQIITGLEVEAVGNLAVRAVAGLSLEPLHGAVAAMAGGIGKRDMDAWLSADERFHRGLLDLSGNERLRREGYRFRDLAQRAHHVALRLVGIDAMDESVAAHASLLDEIKSGDAGRARSRHHAQRERGADLLIGIIEKFQLIRL